MRRPARLVAALVTAPYLAACFAVQPAPIPATPAERRALDVKGVVVRSEGGNGGIEGDRVEFGDVENVTWTEDAVSIVGVPRSGSDAGRLTERTFPLSSLSGVLVRQVEAGKSSIIVGATIVLGTAFLAFLVDGINGGDPPDDRLPQQLQGSGR